MRLPILTAVLLAAALPLRAESWDEIVAAARGQTVYWNAWGGDERTNDFIAWASDQVEAQYGVTIQQVKLADTAEAVTRVVAEKAAGQDADGSVDMIWINGANFLSMKEQGLLHGPFVADLPNARYLDLSPGSAASVDFTVPVEGYEAPWRLAKFVMTYDSARVETPPRSMAALLEWSAANPGRFTHPAVSNFMGATFLKQALIELTPDASALQGPATEGNFDAATAPLWAWYDALRPTLWRGGETFPENASVQEQMLNDGAVDISMAFDPASAAAAIEKGLLPETARAYALEGGTIGNISFVAIPYNAAHKEGAMVVANFLLDPATQAHAQDITVLGSFAVLDPAKLGEAERAAFNALPTSPALPTLEALGPTLIEPHPSWMTMIAEAWAERYTR
ncbi:ABC transporter substrate-binding protein [Albidovulum sediminicola]|uniref:ABC transporter substrate-binding protein n=1 Tax=Albidovulum sediminicola TaxID=2984331 RepID=A0ABT2YXF4_9RHOB|nr:ABC transporter substrate-binding protein [Defluviimonas sp. WL0075]MCV2863510.1 ABC transporter substrate-binding protein [Defluviimonas sp. WL0075]